MDAPSPTQTMKPNPRPQLWLSKLALLLLILAGLSGVSVAFAQDPATVLDTLEVELWPDFDQPSVLVLLTGSLPQGTPLPATVTIPLPGEATLNAVARIDPDSGNLFSDVEFDDSVPGELTFTATVPGFRIEYYAPYEAEDEQRSFNFDWQADLAVNDLSATVQQPASATSFVLDPQPVRSDTRQDGMIYHEIANQAVPAGAAFKLTTNYRMVEPALSIESLSAQPAPSVPVDLTGSVKGEADGFNWAIVAAATVVVIAFGAVAYLIIGNQRRSQRVVKPRPKRSSAPRQSPQPSSRPVAGGVNFCHECGQPVEARDKFCRNCGTLLKKG